MESQNRFETIAQLPPKPRPSESIEAATTGVTSSQQQQPRVHALPARPDAVASLISPSRSLPPKPSPLPLLSTPPTMATSTSSALPAKPIAAHQDDGDSRRNRLEDATASLPPRSTPSAANGTTAPVKHEEGAEERIEMEEGAATVTPSLPSPKSRSRSPSTTPFSSKREDDASPRPILKIEDAENGKEGDIDEDQDDDEPVRSNRRRKSTSASTPLTGKGSKRRGGTSRSTPESAPPQLIGHLPNAERAASETYVEIAESTYFSKQLGNTPYYDPDNARCDCSYKSDVSPSHQACGEYSGCMNRMLQMECEAGDCRCGGKCQNQRFQNREYAPIEIVKTDKKGFGVRTTVDLSADTFVYEYVGEVIGPAPFARKMKEYANEGIKHFYFMALDKEVFIDATKKGGKGRFLNHSCNPNCQVAKWTVGKKMRMGIFTKRDVQKDEELTFNYNVDRYGHVAQECYCGEPNCVGFIGGKTQTDIGGMDDLYIDALGIAEEVEALQLKGSKKKKGRKLDEDYNPTLGPISSDEVPKVASAIRQALQTRRILQKLLERVQMTEDDEVQRQLLRLHGLSLMNNILKEYPKDNEVLTLDLTILTKWKFQTRNKIETSKIEDQVKLFVEYPDEKIATMATELLASWSELSLGFRIPKAQRDAEMDLKRPSNFDIDQIAKRARLDERTPSSDVDLDLFDRSAFVRPEANTAALSMSIAMNRPRKLPPGWSFHFDAAAEGGGGREYYRNDLTGATQWDVPTRAAEPPAAKPNLATQSFDVNALVAEAERAAREAQELELKRIEEAENEKKREREERHRRKKEERDERERAQKDKKAMGLFSAVVVSTMSKYRNQFESDAFKKRAKEVTQILLDKEKKRPSYETDVYDALSSEKEAKVKSFVKDWVKKLLERKRQSRPSSSSSKAFSNGAAVAESSSSSATPKQQQHHVVGAAEIDSPATPQTAPIDVDTPTTSASVGDDKRETSHGTTPPSVDATRLS